MFLIPSNTLNVPGIVGLGKACQLRQLEMVEDESAMRPSGAVAVGDIAQKRDRLEALLLDQIPDLMINGDLNSRLAGNLHLAIPGIPNSAVVARIHDQLAISTGAACSPGVETPSHVLRAINLSEEAIEGALRIGIGKFTTDDEIERASKILSEVILKIRDLMKV